MDKTNQYNGSEMKILFDNIIFSLQKTGGISVVWEEILKRVNNISGLETLFLEYNNDNLNRKSLVINSRNILRTNSTLLKIKRYFNPTYKMNEKHIFHSSYYRTSKNKNAINITTVHDFTYEYFNHGIRKFIHCWQKHRAIRKSDYIICVSSNTKSDLLKFIPDVDKKKIRVIYNGVSNDYYQLDNGKLLNNMPFEPYTYILFVGERKGYKNFELSVNAIAKTNHKLIIVGKELLEKELDLLESTLGKERYNYVGRIPNNELNILYNRAFCLLYPSSYEGFGIPVIEAQRAGCPVIAYNNSSIKEVIGNTPLLIDKLDIDSILQKLTILNNEDIRSVIVKTGIENSKKYSWENMFIDVLNLYNEAWNRNNEN